MKRTKLFLFLILIVFGLNINGQNIIRVHSDSNIIYQEQVENLDSLKFSNFNSFFYPTTGMFELPIFGIDSLTFSNNIEPSIYIIYNGSQTTIINPFSSLGVTITSEAGHVNATSTYSIGGLKYHILGTTSNGSLNITSIEPIKLIMCHANITNPNGAAISINGSTLSEMFLSSGTVNTLNDASSSTANGALYAKSNLTITGLGTLNVNGYKKHGISVDAKLTIESGIINIVNAASDGIHADNFTQNGGIITIIPNSDGIDVSNTISLNGGELSINCESLDVKGIKATNIVVNDGNYNITVSGNQSKAIKSSGNTTINGGIIKIIASGSVVLVASGNGYDPSYCTGVKSDANIIINNGNLTIDCPSSNKGAKGISADSSVVINGGNINITTLGNGDSYLNQTAVTDSYTATCIKANENISIIAGTIICSSSGTGGKCVNADGIITLGNFDANDDLLKLSLTTSGSRFYVSGSGQNADYANPKAMKALGNLTVNSGHITVNCTQSEEGGEGIETKANMYIKGGQINGSTYDDCINSKLLIEISGGSHSFTSKGNDGVDSNGTLIISGGFVVSKGAAAPEEGFDCDNNTFKVLGGTFIGTGGGTSNPTTNVSTQNSFKLSITPNQNICIKNSSNQVILMFALPELTGGGPGGPGGPGGNKMQMLFSDPSFINGSYTIQYGGTINGGTNCNGYYTNATYSGGSSKTFNVNSKLTSLTL